MGDHAVYVAAYGPVPGRQTVPRAELFAVIRLLQRIRPEAGAATSIAVDCEYVVNGAREGTENTMKLRAEIRRPVLIDGVSVFLRRT